MAYAADQTLLRSHYENDVVEKITNATPITSEINVPKISLNNYNQKALTNRIKKPHEAPNRHMGTKYALF